MSNNPEFKKFNSLENSYRENFIHKIREQGYENEALSKILEISLGYINGNRFNAVVSKEGNVNIKMIGKVAGLMTQDILVDIVKDGVIENLESLGEVSEVKKFKQTLQGEVIRLIRPLLLKLD